MTRAAAGVVAALCRRIVAGDLRPGQVVPSCTDVARELAVTVGAADRALAMMRQDGLVEDVDGGPGPVVTAQAPGIAAGWKATARRRGPSRVGPQFLALTVRTAIGVADADGLAGTSMRRIAGQLDVDVVTLHKYLGDRAQLEILMADAVFAGHPLPQSPAGGWRAHLELMCRAQLVLYRRHRWLAEAVSFRQPLLAPHVVGHVEWAVRALAGAGLAPQTAQRLAATAVNFVRGHAMRLAQARPDAGHAMRPAQAPPDAGDAMRPAQAPPDAGDAMRPAQAPPDAEDGRAGVDEDAALFDFGLQRLLDGFARLVPSAART